MEKEATAGVQVMLAGVEVTHQNRRDGCGGGYAGAEAEVKGVTLSTFIRSMNM